MMYVIRDEVTKKLVFKSRDLIAASARQKVYEAAGLSTILRYKMGGRGFLHTLTPDMVAYVERSAEK